MRAILKFNLDNEDDRIAHKQCMEAADMAQFIWELKVNFWRKWKHDETDFTLENYREDLNDLLNEFKIDCVDD